MTIHIYSNNVNFVYWFIFFGSIFIQFLPLLIFRFHVTESWMNCQKVIKLSGLRQVNSQWILQMLSGYRGSSTDTPQQKMWNIIVVNYITKPGYLEFANPGINF